MSKQDFSTKLNGRTLTISTNELAQQANASCTVQYGDTVVLATAVMSKNIREGIGYFPLMVDYEERLYAAGKIKGSRFIKREGRPSDEAILTARLIDRTIRPLFPKDLKNDVQVVLTVLTWDEKNDSDVPALIAASCALHMSDIPWNGPVAAVRIGLIDGSFVLNPVYEERKNSSLDVFVGGFGDKVIMLESGAQEVNEPEMFAAIKYGQASLKPVFDIIEEVRAKVGKTKQSAMPEIDADVMIQQKLVTDKVNFLVAGKIEQIYSSGDKEKIKSVITDLKLQIDKTLKEDNNVTKEGRAYGVALIEEQLEEACRSLVLDKNKRVDGRALDEIRTLSAAVGTLPRIHGSGLFNRGETQVLSIVTLAGPGAEQIIDSMEDDYKKRYMHHYNFPGFSVGEVQPMRGPGRREIGHGALAEKALLPVLPTKEDFPYTIRVVSEVLSSNGSTSQASVCGSTLALMDAGVPIKKAVAGIAMGLITDKNNPAGNYKILTDIQGVEDHAGDMDFKVAGTKDGITAMQMDTKITGLSLEMIATTLDLAKVARLKILAVMSAAISEPRKELSEYAPRIISFKIHTDKIRDVIGPGGKIINEIIDATGVAIDIEDDGTVMVTGNNAAESAKAVDWIKRLTKEVEVGELYEGPVTRLMDFGAFVEILPKRDGLVHISELSATRVDKVEDVVKVGDKVKVKVIEIDDMGRINLSIKQTDPNYDPAQDSRSGRDRNSRPAGNNRGGFNNQNKGRGGQRSQPRY